MKLINVIVIGIAFLLNACSSNFEVKPVNHVYDFHVDKYSKLISSKKSDVTPFLTKVYELNFPENEKDGKFYDEDDFQSTISFYDLNEEGSIIAAKFENDNHEDMVVYDDATLLIPGLQKLVSELHKRGFKYFQIVSPLQISNYLGFPINNISDLATYLIPALNDPEFPDMDLQNGGTPSSIVAGGVTRLVVKKIDNPKPSDIVWSVEDNLF